MSRLRLVVDTHVLVSAFLSQGTPGRVVALAEENEVQLFTSRVLLDESAATLAKKKLAKYVAATGSTAEQMLADYRRISATVTARQLDERVSHETPTMMRYSRARWPHARILSSAAMRICWC